MLFVLTAHAQGGSGGGGGNQSDNQATRQTFNNV